MHKQADSEPEAIYESLKSIIGKDRRLKDLIFSLEMIVFKEWVKICTSEQFVVRNHLELLDV